MPQRSENLRDWQDWLTMGFSSSVLDVTDTKAGNSPHRFYRAIEVKP